MVYIIWQKSSPHILIVVRFRSLIHFFILLSVKFHSLLFSYSHCPFFLIFDKAFRKSSVPIPKNLSFHYSKFQKFCFQSIFNKIAFSIYKIFVNFTTLLNSYVFEIPLLNGVNFRFPFDFQTKLYNLIFD